MSISCCFLRHCSPADRLWPQCFKYVNSTRAEHSLSIYIDTLALCDEHGISKRVASGPWISVSLHMDSIASLYFQQLQKEEWITWGAWLPHTALWLSPLLLPHPLQGGKGAAAALAKANPWRGLETSPDSMGAHG